jgi:hypothetical protein
MTARRKTGSVFALGMRVVRLDRTGAPLVGPTNAYVTDNLVKLDFTMNYREGDEKERTNGSGAACLYYKAPDRVKDLTLDGLELCYPDPELEEFLGGGDVIVDDDDDPVGFAAPEVGTDFAGDGVALELWSSAVHDEGVDDDYPYIRWLFPREKLRRDGTHTIGTDPLAPSYAGSGRQNPNYGTGAFGDWPYISSRVFQHYRVATIPDLSANGIVPVPAPPVGP